MGVKEGDREGMAAVETAISRPPAENVMLNLVLNSFQYWVSIPGYR